MPLVNKTIGAESYNNRQACAKLVKQPACGEEQ
ncbi:hypothetical protein BN439_1262 [Erwinia amylovora Ea644]|nr:hypothetical protein BN439_1262 [Erwinia amylovora Ea644]CCP06366.1 hypothetical protein BN440_1322 [Erwinia amylovora MR1]